MNKLIKHLTNWHSWPFYIFHFPLLFTWTWYYFKSGSFWYFSSSNPTLALGGFEGETKSEMYQHLDPKYYPTSVFIEPGIPFEQVLACLSKSGLQYPFIVKPDMGTKGLLFRVIETQEQLAAYHAQMFARYVMQAYINESVEVSIFYVRHPTSSAGEITAMIKKDLPAIVGDGNSTIEQLIEKDQAFEDHVAMFKQKHAGRLHEVLAADEPLLLSEIANLYNAARFSNITQLVNQNLHDVFDEISHSCNFYYGRYDIKCKTVQDFLEGKNFYILEFNGAGSVANHIHTGTFTLLKAYKEILWHWKQLYNISIYNHRNGFPRWSFRKGYSHLLKVQKHFKEVKKLDKQLVLPEVQKTTVAQY